MLTKYVLPGEKVELKIISNSLSDQNNTDKKTYVSQIYEIISDDRFQILIPIEKAKLILLPMDKEYDVYFYTATGLYHCTAKILDRSKENNIYLLNMEVTGSLSKFQRREFYRFNCAIEMGTRRLEEDEKKSLENKKLSLRNDLPYQKGMIVDISGGGIRFVSEKLYEADSMVLCNFMVPINDKPKQYSIIGLVLQIRIIEERQGLYEHRIQYIGMGRDEREEIIKFIFEEERKNRKREKG
ncbi:MAG: flagellar brake protein [Lachnospiraceae bacterium]|nr:flagellar brake protein [Lachnospiraceae bacterium]